MYSKDRGYTYRVQESLGRSPSYRQPDRPRMQVPPNYSGNAIVDGEERPLGQLSEAEVPVAAELAGEGPIPTFSHVPRVSELGAPARPRPEEGMTLPETPDEPPKAPPLAPTVALAADIEAAAIPVAARPSPPLFDLSRFPFGHGLGLEELLILGLILFLLHENNECPDRGDLDETVILLGLLLLLG